METSLPFLIKFKTYPSDYSKRTVTLSSGVDVKRSPRKPPNLSMFSYPAIIHEVAELTSFKEVAEHTAFVELADASTIKELADATAVE